MPNIQVYKPANPPRTDLLLGNGEGTINAPNARINTWTSRAGLQVGKTYKLRSAGVTYTANCSAVNVASPVATFNNVQ